MLSVYIIDTLINFPIARPVSHIFLIFISIALISLSKNYEKKTVIKILIFSLLISNIFVSYKLYKSSILQLVILNDYNTQNFSIEPESFDRFDIFSKSNSNLCPDKTS